MLVDVSDTHGSTTENLRRITSRYTSVAERASHGLAGKHPTGFQNAASHVVGYAFAPLLAGLDYVVPPAVKSGQVPRDRRLALNNSFSMPPKGKGKKTNKSKARKAAWQKRAAAVRKETVNVAPKLKVRGKQFKSVSVSGTRPKELDYKLITPPATRGYAGGTGPQVTFFNPSRKGCIGMHVSYKLGVLKSNGSASQVSITTVGTTVNGAIPFAPFLQKYNATSAATMASLFERWDGVARLWYQPSCATTTSGRIGIAYVTDPAAVADTYGITGDTGSVTLSTLSNKPNLVEFVPYGDSGGRIMLPWTVVHPTDDMKYTAGAYDPTESVSWGGTISSSLRDQIKGGWVFASAGITAASGQELGDIFIEMRLILCDFSFAPTATSDLRLLRRARENTLQLLIDRELERKTRSKSPS